MNIPIAYPMAILNRGESHNITYSGDQNKMVEREVKGTTADGLYKFYWGDILITVVGEFTGSQGEKANISIYSYRDGYMGGKNLLRYKHIRR